MARSRTEQLLSILTEGELDALKQELAHAGRDRLVRLLASLMTNEKSEDERKEEQFIALFGRAWTKKEDYLLRNELRLLSEHIYDLIAHQENDQTLKHDTGWRDLMLLRGLLKRRAFKPFEILYKRLSQNTLERHDYRTAWRLNEVLFDYLMRYREITPEGMERTREVLLENLDHLKRTYRNDIAENQHRRVVAEQNLKVMGRGTELTTVDLDTDLSKHDTPYARFHDALSHAHASRGEERINNARQAVQEITPVAEHFPSKTMFGYAIYASTLYASHRYEEAERVFNEGIEFTHEHGIAPSPEMLFNYAGTLMRLGRYVDVLGLLDEYHTEFASRPKLQFRSECFRCFCHIFLNNPAKAFEAIPSDLQQRPESEHNYFRFIYVILPYLNDDPEGALREARNFLVYFNRHKEKLQFPQEKRMATLYKGFYTTIYNEVDEEKQRRGLIKVKEEIEKFAEEETNYRDYLYVKWLQDEIEKRLRGLYL